MKRTSLSADDISATLIKKTDFINDAIIKIQNDEVADLDTLDHDIETMCEAIASLPLEDAGRCEEAMTRMIARLDVLADELQAFQDRAETAINNADNTDHAVNTDNVEDVGIPDQKNQETKRNETKNND